MLQTKDFVLHPSAQKSKNFSSPAHAVLSLKRPEFSLEEKSLLTIKTEVTSVLPSDSPKTAHPLLLVSKALQEANPKDSK